MKGHAYETAFARYLKVKKGFLGEGGGSTVFRVEDESGEHFALKEMRPERLSTEKLKRFRNEIEFCRRNPDLRVVPIHDYGFRVHERKDGETVKVPFFVMPLMTCSLRDLMNDDRIAGKEIHYFRDVLVTIAEIHKRGSFHRDLKPENILFDEQQDALLVADFGIAHVAADQQATAVETRAGHLGNNRYEAPEQTKRGAELTKHCDHFALGLMLNELFTGELARGSEYVQVADVRPECAHLDPIVAGLIRKEPGRRLPLAEAIKRFALGDDGATSRVAKSPAPVHDERYDEAELRVLDAYVRLASEKGPSAQVSIDPEGIGVTAEELEDAGRLLTDDGMLKTSFVMDGSFFGRVTTLGWRRRAGVVLGIDVDDDLVQLLLNIGNDQADQASLSRATGLDSHRTEIAISALDQGGLAKAVRTSAGYIGVRLTPRGKKEVRRLNQPT